MLILLFSSYKQRHLQILNQRLTSDLSKTVNKFQEVQALVIQKQKKNAQRVKERISLIEEVIIYIWKY